MGSNPHLSSRHRPDYLEKLISNYCYHAPTNAREKTAFGEINDFLAKVTQNNISPAFILKRNAKNGMSVLQYALYAPISAHGNKALGVKKAQKLLERIIRFCRSAVEAGKITPRAYADLFISPSSQGILFQAKECRNKPLYDIVFAEIQRLHRDGAMNAWEYADQFDRQYPGTDSPLSTAVWSGDVARFREFIEQYKEAISFHGGPDEERYQRELLKHERRSDWNLFHAAIHANEKVETPNPFMISALVEVFYKAFGDEKAPKIIEQLCAEADPVVGAPASSDQPEWLQRLLDVGNRKFDPQTGLER